MTIRHEKRSKHSADTISAVIAAFVTSFVMELNIGGVCIMTGQCNMLISGQRG